MSVAFHAELCRAHWGFCSCFSRHGSFLVMQRGKIPSADLHKGVGGAPITPPPTTTVPGPTWSCPRWVMMGGSGLGCPPTKPLVDARTGRGHPWTKAPYPTPRWGESPHPLQWRGALPYAVHSLSPPPHSEQPPPRRAPLAPALPAAFSWLHYSGEPTRVRGSPGPPRTLFPLSEIPPALWDPSLSLGWPGPPRSPLCPLHMPLAGRSLPRGVEGTGTICLQIRVLSIFKKDDVIYSPPQPLRCQPPALPGPHVCHGVPAGVMGPGGGLCSRHGFKVPYGELEPFSAT